jgi:hypothetical protein
MRVCFQILSALARLQKQGFFPGTAENQVDFSASVESFEKANRVNRSTGSGHADDNPQMASWKSLFCSDFGTSLGCIIESGNRRAVTIQGD